MKTRTKKTVPKKLTMEQLERRWRQEQRANGVTLVPFDTSEIRGKLLRKVLATCEKNQISASRFLNQVVEEYFVERGYLPTEEVTS